MGLFKRIFKVGQSEANALIDRIEDPIKLTEQGIRDMKLDLDKSLKALAEVKAIAIRSKRETEENLNKAKTYEVKAMKLVQQAQAGGLEESEADRLATEALNRKEECERAAGVEKANAEKLETQIAQLNKNVEKLRGNIAKYENELKILKARAKVSNATKKLNKSLTNIDSDSTISMLERMKSKVDEDEALAEAYGDIANSSRSIDEEIDEVLADSNDKGSDALAALKAKMNAKQA